MRRTRIAPCAPRSPFPVAAWSRAAGRRTASSTAVGSGAVVMIGSPTLAYRRLGDMPNCSQGVLRTSCSLFDAYIQSTSA